MPREGWVPFGAERRAVAVTGLGPNGSATEGHPAPDDATPLLCAEHVSKRFPGVLALHNVDFTLNRGEVHALVGQNGAGKSTLVKCISGVHPPDGGRITLEGREITTYSPKHAFDLGIAVVHQRPQLLPWLSVTENVMLGKLPARKGLMIDRRKANEVTRDLLARFRLDIDPEVPVAYLSAPDRQQVAIAKALYRKAKLLILDEPTAALDAQRSAQLFALVEDLAAQGVGVIYVSHHLEEVFRLAHRVTVLRDGELVTTQPADELSQDEVVTLMAGHRITQSVMAESAALTEEVAPALEFVHLETGLLHGVDFVVRPGEVVGVAGLIGAGGHDLARVLFGLDRPTGGGVTLRGRAYDPQGPKQAIAQGIFLVPEDPTRDGLVPVLSVAQNVTLVGLKAITRRGLLSLRREREVARHYVGELSIATASVNTAVRNLSGGNQQKVLLAKALTSKAEVLVLEEPTQGVDVHAKAEIHRIVRDLASRGKAVMVVSTDIRDLLEFVDRIVALRAGRVVTDVPARRTSYAEILDLTVGSVAVQSA
ncbi:MAG: sugar ABC transporter ATP-binding protein [Acidimicrobiales bacterium]